MTCTIGRLTGPSRLLPTSGATETVTINGTVSSDAPAAALVNTATVASDYDPNTSNDSDTATTMVEVLADLAVTKVANATGPSAGTSFTYTVTVTNNGPSVARDLVLADAVPTSSQGALQLISVAPGAGLTCPSADVTTTSARCTATSLAVGASLTLTVTTWVTPGTTQGTNLENRAEITAATPDPDATNNSAAAIVPAGIPWADVAIDKTAPATAVSGRSITYTLGVHNLGPADATSVVITDQVPAWITVSDASATSGTCTINPPAASKTPSQSQTVSCAIGRLTGPARLLPTSGGTAEVTITGTLDSATPAGGLTNTASVASAHDPNPDNDEDSATTVIGNSADLAVTKVAVNPSPSAGTSTTFTITVTNNGPSLARSLSLADGVVGGAASGLVFEEVIPGSGLTCADLVPTENWRFDCTAPQLAVGASLTLTAKAWVGNAITTGTRIENTVEVSSLTPDPDSSNNTATAVLEAGVPWADVAVTKTAPATAVAGRTISYGLEARNLGPADATSVVVSDEVPAWITVSSATASSGSCTVTPPAASKLANQSQIVSCAVGRLVGPTRTVQGSGGRAEVTITGTLDSATPAGPLPNTGRVDSDYDPNAANDEDTATTTVTVSADLAVTKVANATGPSAGTSFTYTVTVTNNGPSLARDLVLADAIPNSTVLELILVTPGTGMTCPVADFSATGARCTLPSLAVGASVTLTVTTWVTPGTAQGTNLENRAEVTSATPDPDSTNNSASAIVPAGVPWADVAIDKTAPATVVAGRAITYTLGVRNLGPADATGVVVTDEVPAAITVSSATADQGTCSVNPPAASKAPGQSQTVTCTVGRLAGPARLFPGSGGTAGITIEATVNPETPAGPLVNTARVASAHDPNADNDEATATTLIAVSADLAVTKVANSTGPSAGTSFTYTVTVTNNGPSYAQNVVLADAVPAGSQANLKLLSIVAGAGLTCPASDLTSSAARCTAGTLAVGQSASATITAWVTPDTPQGRSLENTIEASAATPDPTMENNSASAIVPAGIPWADVAMSKTGPATGVAGRSITYTLGARNLGPADATSVVITDVLPAVITAESAVADQGSCVIAPLAANKAPNASQTVTCTVGRIVGPATPGGNLGGSVSVVVSGTLDSTMATGPLVNTARVDSDHDPNAANDSDSATTQISQSADVEVTKVSNAVAPPSAGTSFTYGIVVTNHGPSMARDLVISDAVASGSAAALRLLSASATGGVDCPAADLTAGSARCTLGSLAVGASVSLTVTAWVTPGTLEGQALENGAQVAASTPDPDMANNADSATVLAGVPWADVAVAKTASTTAVAGEGISYTIIATNHGPADARAVVITDAISPWVTATSATSSQGSCTLTPSAADKLPGVSQALSCGAGTILGPTTPGGTVGGAVTIQVSGTVDPAAPLGPMPNTASVDSSHDPNSANNSSTASTNIIEVADLSVVKTGSLPYIPQVTEEIVYSIEVTNHGPSVSRGSILEDLLPSVFFLDSVAGLGITCPDLPIPTPGDSTHETLTCAVGMIP
ncbi:MAG: DUF11 domain-containing protein, partial [Micrococcales bacterium]|nr:DUF11 domain-containing protein [Micrococcales bacterium]